ncbi:hypothetical protein [Streptomyces chromofuscus]|uniref:hypothetical protein n=1 Tax=Streptomyces chromofuscus TaxID=42881 RepID=UPI003570B8FC
MRSCLVPSQRTVVMSAPAARSRRVRLTLAAEDVGLVDDDERRGQARESLGGGAAARR